MFAISKSNLLINTKPKKFMYQYMDYIGLLFEIIFFCAGIALYSFAMGWMKFSSFEAEAKAAKIRRENGGMLRILSLAVVAIMSLNIYLFIRDLM